MIPVKLKLHNFMSYRDIPALSFESIHTACISGNNGNGKSALIDALTWALWGQTRANNDDELVYTGQNEVEVDFEFAVNRQNYRILRKHSKPKTSRSSGQTLLEFQAVTPQGYKTLTADTVTQTQLKITQLLHMDYDTFINSAFIRQGRADEFTKKRPSERKQVLANILQLSIYDALDNQARDLAKDQDTAITQLETAVDAMKEELINKSQYQSDFENAQIQLSQAEVMSAEQNRKLSGLRKDRELLETKKSQLDEIISGITNNQRNLKLWTDQAQQSRAQIDGYHKLISQRAAIEENYALLITTRKRIQEFDQRFKLVNNLVQTKHKLELAISRASKELTGAHAVSINRIADWERATANLPQIQNQMKQLSIQMTDLDESEKQLVKQQDDLKQLRSQLVALNSRQTQLTRLVAEIEDKLKLLVHPQGATCPLCDSELGHEGQHKIEQKYLVETNACQSELAANGQIVSKFESQERQLEKHCLQMEANIKNTRSALQNKQGTLSKAIADIFETQIKIVSEKAALEEIESRLARRDFAQEEQAALAEIESEIEATQYDAQKHELLRTQLSGLEKFEAPRHQLAEAEKQAVLEQGREAQALGTISEIKQTLETYNQRKQTLTFELEGYVSLIATLSNAERECQILAADQKRIQEIVGGAKNRLERLAQVESRLKTKTEQLVQLSKQSKILKELSQAFGKKGIQAMLIEMAIPEIESEANQLLARMTENRMFIKIETQRETKKGDVMETLDINISDELGTRNYEMFSGGEAFRIDFAIRIALSKLLARRAGAPLPTLIIDEGFGTQDGSGIEKIKEAITSIQDDFEKILVITHINDFKDAFPVRIEVVKTAEGSTVYLN
jgi:exonuclease SbcC